MTPTAIEIERARNTVGVVTLEFQPVKAESPITNPNPTTTPKSPPNTEIVIVSVRN